MTITSVSSMIATVLTKENAVDLHSVGSPSTLPAMVRGIK